MGRWSQGRRGNSRHPLHEADRRQQGERSHHREALVAVMERTDLGLLCLTGFCCHACHLSHSSFNQYIATFMHAVRQSSITAHTLHRGTIIA